jgi:hypothetical protein
MVRDVEGGVHDFSEAFSVHRQLDRDVRECAVHLGVRLGLDGGEVLQVFVDGEDEVGCFGGRRAAGLCLTGIAAEVQRSDLYGSDERKSRYLQT